MTLRHLTIFISVCENKSTVRAAEKLHIAQPSISFAIKEIESHYGIKLFDRISRKLILTEEGKVFLYQAREIIDKVNQLESSLRDCDLTKKIKLGCSTTIAIFLLPEILKKFEASNRMVKIELTVRDSNTLADLVLKNEIDLALIETPVNKKDIIATPFYCDSLLLFLSKDNILSKEKHIKLVDLENNTLILREKHSAVRKLIDSILISNNIKNDNIWDSTSTQAIISLVEQNLGLTILPSLWASNLKNNNYIINKEIEDISLKREYMIIHHKNKYISPTLDDLINNCKSNYSQ